MQKLLNVFFCIVVCSLSVSAQANVKFFAQVDAYKVVEGSYVTVEFILENDNGGNFKPPSFTDFDVLSGPNKSSSMTIVNGRRSNKISLSYSIRPKGLGKKIIGKAQMQTQSGPRTTEPITIEVVKGSSNPVGDDEQFFIITQVTDTIAYVGQQLVLDYKLYTLLDVRSVNMLTEPNFDGFYTESLRSNRSGYQREIYNGKEYYTKSVKKIILFPQQTGTYKIESVPIDLGIASKNNKSRNFFFSSQLIPKRVVTNPITIIVRNTPSTDLNFSGAVGQYTMSANTPKRSLTTDEAIIVKMKIVGNGDNKTVLSPSWPANEKLEIYDPNVIEDEVYKGGAEITHTKTFEYLLVPKQPGRYNLTAAFTYYNPDSSRYITLKKTLPSVNVLQGSNTNVVIAKKEKVDIEGIFPKTKLQAISQKSGYGSWWHYSMLGLILFSCLGIVIYHTHLNKSGKTNPDEIRKNKAYGVAISRLQKAKSLIATDNSKPFFEEITVALKKYISDKYKIPALHISKSETLSQLSSLEIQEDVLSKISQIFNNAEVGLYAPSSDASRDMIYEDTLKVISQLES